jgi:type I restriction-modification system DNA methylase subunit
MNERITENLVRTMLRDNGYYDDKSIIIEEQKSSNPKINKLLSTASKSGKGKGFPEFIISFSNKPDEIIIIECKANTTYHESNNRDKYKDYAVDGALLYASYFKEDFTVTAIAVSGQTEREKKISTFLWLKGNLEPKSIPDKILLNPFDLSKLIAEQQIPITEAELVTKAIAYNELLNDYSLEASKRCTLISTILIALQNKPFLESYKSYEYTQNKELLNSIFIACESVLKQNKLDETKTKIIIDEYKKFQNTTDFISDTIKNKKTKQTINNTVLRDLITNIKEEILPYVNKSEFDILGKFYTQFIKYAQGDKKTGLVLTPTHITDLFCDIAELTEDDIVFDPCCGTGGFLVSAMNYMLNKAGNNTLKHKEIKSNQLLGIEKDITMFANACSNMMMRGDGTSCILQGDCFDDNLKKEIILKKPTVSFLNPPYQDGNSDEQLEFIENAIECIVKGGICIAICQMSTVVSSNKEVIKVKERLLEKHTLKAVLSMPEDLFYPVGVVTCILVFEAHNPHPKNKETFFGYFKNDGFLKVKNKGRVDFGEWSTLKGKWLNSYINNKNIDGLSVTKCITAKDEWCAEAYMKTDFSTLTKEDFTTKLYDYIAFLFSNKRILEPTTKSITEMNFDLSSREWKSLGYEELFKISRGKRLTEISRIKGNIPYYSASAFNNGLTDNINNPLFLETSAIIYTTFGDAYYVKDSFTASDEINIFKNEKLNIFNGIFLCSLIDKNKYKYSFGRKAFKKQFIKDKIKVPITQQGSPDWQFMEDYIKSLPYSKNLS